NKQEFRILDKELYKISAERTLYKGCEGNPPRGIGFGPKKNWTEIALIKNEIDKKTRRIPVRQLIKRSFKSLLTLKPVWLLTPPSVSQLIPRVREIFDVLIIDEASQLEPQKAIASIVRSKQLIVVGDDQQMPPSKTFKAELERDEDEIEIDAESILDIASKRLGNTVSLNWHYRSRHPNLIKFSNHHFYDDKLEIFPSPQEIIENPEMGIEHIKVDGVYKGQKNRIEIEQVLIQLKKCIISSEEKSIGIVGMNRSQTEQIQEEVNLLINTDKIVQDYYSKWENDKLGSLFIKNLENVQGDERDIIIISTVYGKDENGKMFQRFGPINSSTGHRRLNVLFTRAKSKLILITSMVPNDITLGENVQKGKRILKDYIEYAATGKIETGEDLKLDADSDFEVSVGNFLKDAGFNVKPQVGVKGFRIDLGVTHDAYPYGYIAGIECDGSTYHSSFSARDRDNIRQSILESHGWNIYRVWSTDWFDNPENEKDRLLEFLNELINKYKKTKINKINNQQDDLSIKIEEKTLINYDIGPVGEERSLPDNEDRKFYQPHPNLFEVWIDNKKFGTTEKQPALHNSSATLNNIEIPTYKTYLNDKTFKRHTDIYQAINWLYDEYENQLRN
ncbi:AAA domain-containing protein, partial [Alphaproteobacteria bacterium]|nr:AAA domain-containing protein [Alphaproteobacteria bacterium]